MSSKSKNNESLIIYYKSKINDFSKIFQEKIIPAFNPDNESENFANAFVYNNVDKIDNIELSKLVSKLSTNYYLEVDFAKYTITVIFISSLYHIWEQQVRHFLFKQLIKTISNNFSKFCSNGFKSFNKEFENNGIIFRDLSSWEKLDELRLLSNIIKHGDGGSAEELYKSNPNLILVPPTSEDSKLDLTMIEQLLKIKPSMFKEYKFTIIEFWNELQNL